MSLLVGCGRRLLIPAIVLSLLVLPSAAAIAAAGKARHTAETLGQFLDTPASAAWIPSYAARPNCHVDDYLVGPSGWLTFNQFFAREVKPGKRPIAAPCDDKVIVSPADSVFAGTWTRSRTASTPTVSVYIPLSRIGTPRDAFGQLWTTV